MSGSVRTNDGSGPNSAVGPDKSWQTRKETAQPGPVLGSGAGFHEATAQKLPPRPKLQRLLEILRSDSFPSIRGRPDSPAGRKVRR
jgi:hypothetical protein